VHFAGLVLFIVQCAENLGKIKVLLPDLQAASVSYPEPAESCPLPHISFLYYSVSVTAVVQVYAVECVWQMKINYA